MAADLARRILRWPLHSKNVSRVDVTVACEKILRSYAEAASVPALPTPVAEQAAERSSVATSYTGTDETNPQGELNIPLAGEAGGGLPIEAVKIPPFPPSLAGPAVPRPLSDGEPALLPPTGKGLPYVMFPENEHPSQDPLPPEPLSPVPHQLDPELRRGHDAKQLSATSAPRVEDELERLPDLDLIRRLSDPRSWMACAVEDQLRDRGFRDADIRLARVLASPDPQDRRQLIRSLDRLSKSPSRWLLWLSSDPDPSVRRQAVSLMATSQDPRLQRRLREMLIEELDTGVREALLQWNDQVSKRR